MTAPTAPAAPSAPAPLLRITDFTVGLGKGSQTRPLVHPLSLDITHGEALGLVGESGSGKSVSTRAVMRLLPEQAVTGGRIEYAGEDVLHMDRRRLRAYRAREVAMIHQDPASHINPLRTIGDFLTEGLRHLPRPERRTRAIAALQDVGIPDAERRLAHYPHQLSGGLLQRVMIAAAVLCEPKLLLADEPTTALDVTTQSEVMAVLGEARQRQGLAMLFITHDLDLAAAVTDRLAVMYAGTVVESGPTEAVARQPAHPYTIGLMASQPSVRGHKRRLTPIPGRPAAAYEVGQGCVFAARCALAQDRCRAEVPQPRRIGTSVVRCHRAEETELASFRAQGVL